MKRLALLGVVAVVIAGVAMPAFATEPVMRAGKAVKVGRTPALEEALKLMKETPDAFGVEREQPRPQFPDFLLDREPFVTVRPDTMRGFTQGMSPSVKNSFGGYDSDDNSALFGFRVMPPDVEGDVGREHYVQWNNLGWKYWDKATKTENGPFAGNTFWVGHGDECETDNDGDPVVLYDHFASRWVFTQFNIGPGFACFAISDGEDPTGPYTTYSFPISIAGFNDYPKMGVYTTADGSESAYHMTTNEFSPFMGVNLTGFDRDAIIAADPAAGFVQFTILPAGAGERFAFSLQPPHLDGGSDPAPAGQCGKYIQAFDEETWGDNTGVDGYRMWDFCTGYGAEGGGGPSLTEQPFLEAKDSFDSELCGFGSCVPQPNGQLLDTLAQFTMFRFSQYMIDGRLEGVISHTIDLGTNLAGIRWAEFDLSDSKSILDEGVIDAGIGDGGHRWMPSVAQNADGDMLVGYSLSSSATFPSVFHAARRANDPPQTLKVENQCIAGTGSQSGGSRWGDYSSVSVDPSDGCTFWYTHEYVETTGSFQWDTQVCVAAFDGCQDAEPCDTLTLEGPTKVNAGEDFTLEVCGANVEALVRFSGGRNTNGSVRNVPGCGAVSFDIGPAPNNFGSEFADGNGEASSVQNLPGSFGGSTVYYQALDRAKCELSNVLAVEVNSVP